MRIFEMGRKRERKKERKKHDAMVSIRWDYREGALVQQAGVV
jgi:hypothetical protein